MRKALLGAVGLVLVVGSYAAGQASEKDETVLTVRISSAEHEALEGYFSLGEQATVMARPGSELYDFLSRQRDRKVTITLRVGERQLSRLDRD